MDVSELLAFQPDKPSSKGDSESMEETPLEGMKRKKRIMDGSHKPIAKRAHMSNPLPLDLPTPSSSSSSSALNGRSMFQEDKETLARVLEDDPAEENEDEMGESKVRKLLVSFEKKAQKNQEMRVKYPDLPEKFMESEIDLNECIQALHVISTAPQHYNIFIQCKTIPKLLQLLSHENTDVAIEVVSLLQEMTSPDDAEEYEDELGGFIDALLKKDMLKLLVENLSRLDDKSVEESEGIQNSLSCLENVLEIRPEVAVEAGKSGFVGWILNKFKTKSPFDENRLYYSEILSILVYNKLQNLQLVGDLDGIDVLLSQLATFKKTDPRTDREAEMMANLFNSLCSCLTLPSNRIRFLKGEGLQLMNLMLREKKKMCKSSAIKVLNYAMEGSDGVENCLKFVDILGLRVIFAYFMRYPTANKKSGPNKKMLEEYILSIVGSLLRNCEGSQKARVLNKFTESDHEKVERLMELHFEHLERSEAVTNKINKQRKDIEASGDMMTDDLDLELEQQQLEVDIPLQLVDYILVEICLSCSQSVRERVVQMLHLRGGDIATIKNVIKGYASRIELESDQPGQKAFQEKLMQMIDRF